MRRLVDHLGSTALAYLAASAAAGLAYTVLLATAIQITGSIEQPSEQPFMNQLWALAWFAFFATLFIGATAFMPAVPVIGAIILSGRTDMVSYIVAGLVISVAAIFIARQVPFFDRVEISWLTLASGAVAGIVFGTIHRTLTRRS